MVKNALYLKKAMNAKKKIAVDIYFLLSNQSARKVLFTCLANTKLKFFWICKNTDQCTFPRTTVSPNYMMTNLTCQLRERTKFPPLPDYMAKLSPGRVLNLCAGKSLVTKNISLPNHYSAAQITKIDVNGLKHGKLLVWKPRDPKTRVSYNKWVRKGLIAKDIM